jgi:RHS repeat-associated protein
MKVYSDNGENYGYYGYDDKGERTYKIELHTLSSNTNTYPNQKNLSIDRFMLYPNGYMNINQNGEYTKHYYAGDQRIASKIGTGFVLKDGIDLCRKTHNMPNISFNYFIDRQIVQERIMIDELGATPYPNETVQMTSQPCCGDFCYMHMMSNYEYELYFYTGDHLNSTQAVSDINGSLVQGIFYAPFGEVIYEDNAYWHRGKIPDYTFNAKELDEENGMYYYSARYYNPPIFISRDPLFEKRPWMSVYAYCSNNPINRIDPDGRIDFPLKGYYAVNKKDYANGALGLANAIVRTSLYKEHRSIGTSPHIGIDYRASIGTPVYSLGDGTVTNIGTMKNGIKYITIEYENGDQLRFLHMDKIADDMKVGGKVYEGQIIGDAGNSGQYRSKNGAMKSYAPHLHVDAKDKDGNSISPEQNKYGTIDNETFFKQFGGDHRKLYQHKQEAIKKLNEAGGVIE